MDSSRTDTFASSGAGRPASLLASRIQAAAAALPAAESRFLQVLLDILQIFQAPVPLAGVVEMMLFKLDDGLSRVASEDQRKDLQSLASLPAHVFLAVVQAMLLQRVDRRSSEAREILRGADAVLAQYVRRVLAAAGAQAGARDRAVAEERLREDDVIRLWRSTADAFAAPDAAEDQRPFFRSVERAFQILGRRRDLLQGRCPLLSELIVRYEPRLTQQRMEDALAGITEAGGRTAHWDKWILKVFIVSVVLLAVSLATHFALKLGSGGSRPLVWWMVLASSWAVLASIGAVLVSHLAGWWMTRQIRMRADQAEAATRKSLLDAAAAITPGMKPGG